MANTIRSAKSGGDWRRKEKLLAYSIIITQVPPEHPSLDHLLDPAILAYPECHPGVFIDVFAVETLNVLCFDERHILIAPR
ncbi:hypothetical protein BJV74DRAFT_597851 [Russula compacta]|nr:hypothetical protein BJV74DRAFT_597851 [Russula compacta]